MSSRRVLVALSGGVDSAVAAALLQQEGCEVIGVTLRLRPCDRPGAERSCCGIGAVEQARAVAGRLGIHHFVLDCRQMFSERVLRPAWEEYHRGRTPNPCIRCNAEIKFGLLLERARALGAAAVATGHHARIEPLPGGGWALRRGVDPRKDQSYFLYAVPPGRWPEILFPVGRMTKEEVRRRARELGLPNAERPESQDACLGVGPSGFAEALRELFGGPARAGRLCTTDGRVLGEHQGIHRFTIGQRRGLGVALGKPAYVVRIEEQTGDVVLSCDPQHLLAQGLLAEQACWQLPPPASGFAAEVQIRHAHRAVPAWITPGAGGVIHVAFEQPQRAVAPGQAAVLYQGDRLLGGAVIRRALACTEAPAVASPSEEEVANARD
jgi:tRNA-specific 2-thiouridylase